MANMRGEFLKWSGEHGGFGCEEDAFDAGWKAALGTSEAPDTSTNTGSLKFLPFDKFDDICRKYISDFDSKRNLYADLRQKLQASA